MRIYISGAISTIQCKFINSKENIRLHTHSYSVFFNNSGLVLRIFENFSGAQFDWDLVQRSKFLF